MVLWDSFKEHTWDTPKNSSQPCRDERQLIIVLSVVVRPRCLLHHILSLIAYTFRENRDFVLIIIMQFMMSANSRIRFGMQIVFVSLYITPYHYHHCANLSKDIELTKCLSDIFCRVCKIQCVISQLSIVHYMGPCVFSLPIPLWWLRKYIPCLIIIIKSEVWTTIHSLGLGHETMVCAVCLYIPINSWYGQVALWDICVLVVFALNLALCHRHAALLPC